LHLCVETSYENATKNFIGTASSCRTQAGRASADGYPKIEQRSKEGTTPEAELRFFVSSLWRKSLARIGPAEPSSLGRIGGNMAIACRCPCVDVQPFPGPGGCILADPGNDAGLSAAGKIIVRIDRVERSARRRTAESVAAAPERTAPGDFCGVAADVSPLRLKINGPADVGCCEG
jgi:hypothetical protein